MKSMKATVESILIEASNYLTPYYEVWKKGNLASFEYEDVEYRVVEKVNQKLQELQGNNLKVKSK